MIARLEIERPKSLAVLVEERLRDAIVNAELDFGQALTEDAAGLVPGVSRTPLREALTRLEGQGLVVVVPKRGTFVFQPTLEDVGHLAAFRLMLELGALERCRAGAPEATLAGMRVAFAAMGEARARGETRAYARADTAFHDGFFAHCGNPYLANAYRTISGRVAALRAHLSVPRSEQQDLSFGEHGEMIEAFGRDDLAGLSRILERHILRAATVYAEALGAAGPRDRRDKG